MGTFKKMLFAAFAAAALIGNIEAQQKQVEKGAIALVYDRAQDETTLPADADPVAAMIDTSEFFNCANLAKSEDTKPYASDANVFVAWKGFIKINADGAYTISIIDGAEFCYNTMVRIAGKEIINLAKNNDQKRRRRGNNFMASSSVQLQAGYYEIMIIGAWGGLRWRKSDLPNCIKVTVMKKGNPLAKQEITPASLLHEK